MKFFDTVEKLKVTVNDFYVNDTSVAAEIIIYIDEQPLLVTDVITVNEEGNINSIRAYKG